MTLETLKSASVETLRAFGPDQYILALAATFPSLRGRVESALENRGTARRLFDAVGWEKSSRGASHGERAAVCFVLTVWNYDDAAGKVWKFDAVDALSVWDGQHRRAFMTWAANPVWP